MISKKNMEMHNIDRYHLSSFTLLSFLLLYLIYKETPNII